MVCTGVLCWSCGQLEVALILSASFQWLQLVSHAQPSHVHSHYSLWWMPALGWVPQGWLIFRAKPVCFSKAGFSLPGTSPDSAFCTCLATAISCVYKLSMKGLNGAVAASVHWLVSCKAHIWAAFFHSSHQHDASESTRSRSKEGPETQRHKSDRSSRWAWTGW